MYTLDSSPHRCFATSSRFCW